MSNPEQVTVSMEEYLDLKDTESLYLALESAGVDNWVGYDYAMEIYRDSK